MYFTNPDDEIEELKMWADLIPLIGGGAAKKRNQLQRQFYENLKKFMIEHPEYYGCPTE